jgi:uncharacterized protein CbrC (UPF0167 family)
MRVGRQGRLWHFPLYAAAVEASREYTGPGECALCGDAVDARLMLSIGADVIYTCAGCEQQFAVAADEHDGQAKKCPVCEASAEEYALGDDPSICFACLRDGRAAFTKDTEFGMVRWEDAVRGRTHGVPGLRSISLGFSLTEPDADGWVSVTIPSSVLHELVRTPTYVTWQGEQWLFCCDAAMVYCGECVQADLVRYAPDNPEAAFLDVFEHAERWMWNHVPHNSEQTSGWGFYVFECQICGRLRGHFDMT